MYSKSRTREFALRKSNNTELMFIRVHSCSKVCRKFCFGYQRSRTATTQSSRCLTHLGGDTKNRILKNHFVYRWLFLRMMLKMQNKWRQGSVSWCQSHHLSKNWALHLGLYLLLFLSTLWLWLSLLFCSSVSSSFNYTQVYIKRY